MLCGARNGSTFGQEKEWAVRAKLYILWEKPRLKLGEPELSVSQK